MGWFQDNIFRLFGNYDKASDVNKDITGKGTYERYNECIGVDIDDEIYPLIQNLYDNVKNPLTAFERFVPFIESGLGFNRDNNTLYVSSSLEWRRKIAQYKLRFDTRRGTIPSYVHMYALLGLDAIIQETYGQFGFDSLITFDHPVRVFDQKCAPCSTYSILLTGEPELTPELHEAILSIIRYNEPINARLSSVSYNGEDLTPVETSGDYNDDYNNDFY